MPKRIMEGNVVSNKMDKTVTVLVERRFLHPVYKKYVKRSTRFSAHDEGNLCQDTERVHIHECAPISKRKTSQVISGKAGEENRKWLETRHDKPEPVKQATAKTAAAKKTTAKTTAKTSTKKSTAKSAAGKDSSKSAATTTKTKKAETSKTVKSKAGAAKSAEKAKSTTNSTKSTKAKKKDDSK